VAAPSYQTVTVYGPFHRVANPRTQRAEEMRAILWSGELWGSPARSSLIPAVKAYFGSLPEGQSGFEFFSLAPPDRPWGGVVYWHERDDGAVWIHDGQAKVNVLVRRVDQDL
jgi:hypothetical protein